MTAHWACWEAIREVFPQTCEQHCQVHLQGNALDALSTSTHMSAKAAPKEILHAADESTFATHRLNQRATKSPGSRAAGIAIAFTLLDLAQSC